MRLNLKQTALMLALAASTSACATAYGELGRGWMDDGVAADQLARDTFRIRSRGNAMTEHALVEDLALLRAAETVKGACMTHFVVLEGADRTEVDESFSAFGSSPTDWAPCRAASACASWRLTWSQSRLRKKASTYSPRPCGVAPKSRAYACSYTSIARIGTML